MADSKVLLIHKSGQPSLDDMAKLKYMLPCRMLTYTFLQIPPLWHYLVNKDMLWGYFSNHGWLEVLLYKISFSQSIPRLEMDLIINQSRTLSLPLLLLASYCLGSQQYPINTLANCNHNCPLTDKQTTNILHTAVWSARWNVKLLQWEMFSSHYFLFTSSGKLKFWLTIHIT